MKTSVRDACRRAGWNGIGVVFLCDFLKKAEDEPVCKGCPELRFLSQLGLNTKLTETKDYFVIGEVEVND